VGKAAECGVAFVFGYNVNTINNKQQFSMYFEV